MTTPITTFVDASHLVWSLENTPNLIRSAIRNERVDDAVIANRSNYTRVTFDHRPHDAAFLVPVGPYSIRVRATRTVGASANFIGQGGENVGMGLSANEMRGMAYALLAAANWIDGRDNDSRAAKRKPAVHRPWGEMA